MKNKLIGKLSKFFLIFLLSFLFSCQPVTITQDVVFDNSLLSKISIHAEQKIINNNYDIKYTEPYIDYSLDKPPILRLNNWLDENIVVFGSENILKINILDASISKIERANSDKKKFAEKSEYFYEIHFVIEFVLIGDNDLILAIVKAESTNSTTSSKYISINEKERIIDGLILISLEDISNKSEELFKKHMIEFML